MILYVGNSLQSSYGQSVKTLNVKVQLDKSVIKRGDTQTIRYRVLDAMSGQPVSGAIVRATVGYADAVTVRQFTAVTDASGQASISWQIESNATLVVTAVPRPLVPLLRPSSVEQRVAARHGRVAHLATRVVQQDRSGSIWLLKHLISSYAIILK